MADVHSKRVRSYNMSRIRAKNTKPELMVRKFLHLNGFRFRLHYKKLPGKPDIVLAKHKTVVLIHGCFWHHHQNCRFAKFPKNNWKYWTPKILNNIARDEKIKKDLKKNGWKVITIWECRLKNTKYVKTLDSLLNKIG